ncbi:MAG: TonB-dependent receptor [Acidobacteria bacterium]|nr:TonB-dependent receptor [Acidobacteriota bacterium]
MTAKQAMAQGAVTTATLTGDVADSTGAVLPGAKISVINQATGLAREITSDHNGHFIVPQLPAGRYEVSVELTGFKKTVIHDVLLNVGATEVVKIKMDVGELIENIDVSAEAVERLETTKAEVSNLIQEVQVQELPLNQRSFTALVTQQPGLVQMTSATPPTVLGAATNTGSYISAGGLMGTSVAYLIDGVNFSNGNFTAPGTAAAGDMPGVEAIQEFKVITHNFSAVYGGAAGAVVSFATRSGTNNFHGSVYEFLRNDIFDSRAFFDREKPPFRRNQFGGALGGPIKRDRTFFFANYEGLRQSLTTTDIAFVPDDCARNGGVGGSCNFPVIGPNGPVAISPAIRSILDLYPRPNGFNLGGGIAEHVFQNKQPTRQDFGLAHITHAFTPNDQFSARYSITDADASAAFHFPTFEFVRTDRVQNYLLKWARIINPSLVNTASFSYLRSSVFAATEPVAPLRPDQYTGNPARQTIGVITVGGGSAGTTSGTLTLLGNDDASPFHLVRNNFVFNDDLVYTRGGHTLKFGGMVNRFQWNWNSSVIPGGSYTFLTLNDFLAANPAVFLIRRDGADASFGVRTTLFAWYVEDAWRARPNLTITLGLRHEFQVPILKDIHNKLGNWQHPEDTAVHVGIPYNNYSKTQFQPRLGISYDPWSDGKTVIRAGFGVFNEFLGFEGNAQGDLQWNAPQPVLNTFFGQPIAPGFLPQIPFPTCATCTAPTPYVGLVTGLLLPVNSPTSIQWHLEVARELPAKLNLTLTYAGSNSYHIPRKIEANHNLPCRFESGQPVFSGGCGTAAPAVSQIAFSLYSKRFDAIANSNSFTVQVGRRLAGGLTFQTSYAFTKAISESDAFNSNNVIRGVAQASQYPANRNLDRSESLFSIRHRFTENVVFDLPLGRGRKFMNNASRIAEAFLGGWTISSLAEVRSGYPFSVLAGFGITGVGDAIDFPDRPNLLRSNMRLGGVSRFFDPKAYALQEPGRLGNAPRTSVRGPNFANLDFGLSKRFPIKEDMDLQFRTEFFNVLNHANFALPFNQLYVGFVPQFNRAPTQAELDALPCNLTAAQAQVHSCNPQAGRISSTVGVPRQIQFSLKLSF